MKHAALTAMLAAAVFAAGAAAPDSLSLDAPGATPPEGIWRMLPEGAVFAVRPAPAAGCYELVVLDSPDYTVAPGTPMGTMSPTATPWVYDAALSGAPGRAGSAVRNFMVEVDPEGGRLKMRSYSGSHRLSVRRWAGYLFRLSVDPPNRPDSDDGAVRLAPQPGEIVFL